MHSPGTIPSESLRQFAVKPSGAERFAEANAGLLPAVAMTPIGDNDTSVIRGPAIMKAGRLKSYEAFRRRACEKSLTSGVFGEKYGGTISVEVLQVKIYDSTPAAFIHILSIEAGNISGR